MTTAILVGVVVVAALGAVVYEEVEHSVEMRRFRRAIRRRYGGCAWWGKR